MIQRILIGFAIATVAILILLWLATGGIQNIADIARNFNPSKLFSGGAGQFRLPWQPAVVDGGFAFDVENTSNEGTEVPRTSEEELSDSQREYERLRNEITDAKVFGEPSPYRGMVTIGQANEKAASPSAEYIELRSAWGNTAPISLAGWSLQSALTGLRAFIPQGAGLFVLGAVNAQESITINPNGVVFVSTGASPVGTSFRENACTGYLEELQTFIPGLSQNCPQPSELLPLTPQNLSTYGDACYDIARSLSSCTLPQTLPASVSPACRIFLSNNLSYNGCVQNYRHTQDFIHDSWRVYLNASGELWRNTHDIIRLLDAEGRTVDVISY
jgi:hypothetical protein